MNKRYASRSTQRTGFSLLEMLLALAILGASLSVLAQVADTGVDAANEARDLAVARLICQSKMSEVLINATMDQDPQSQYDVPVDPIDSLSPTTFTYSLDVQQAPLDGMLMIRVMVSAFDSGGNPTVNYVLDRWMVDPALGLEELELDEEAAKEEAAGTAETEEG